MNTPLAIANSNQGTVDLPGVEGQNLSWRDNVPLYSAVGFDAAALPAEISPFSYAIGGTVANNFASPLAGVTNATNYHTNLRVPRQLPSPEVFVFDRIRAIIMPAGLVPGTSSEVALDDVFGAVGAAGLNVSNSRDVLILQSLTLRFELEQKLYAEAPLWMFPANVGVFGSNSSAWNSVLRSDTTANMRKTSAVHWAGEGWRFADSMPPVLTSSAVLDCKIRYDHPGTAPSIQVARYLFIVMQGRHGRAVR